MPPPPVTATDRTFGRAEAPVTLILDAAMTGPHCAQWIRSVLPEVKARLEEFGLQVIPGDGASLARYLQQETQIWHTLIKERKLSAE